MADLSSALIHSKAQEGYYYVNNQNQKWERLGLLERIFRYCLSFLYFDNTERACEKRSWKKLETVDALPADIETNIKKHFKDSRSKRDKLNHVATSISKIYTKHMRHVLRREQPIFPCNIDIQLDGKERLFHVKVGEQKLATVVSTNYAMLDFYDASNKKVYQNKHDELIGQPEGELASEVKHCISPDFNRNDHFSILSNEFRVLFEVEREGDESTYVVRDTDKKIIAVANRVMERNFWIEQRGPSWSITLVDPDAWKTLLDREVWKDAYKESKLFGVVDMRVDLLVFALLKMSQATLPNPYEKLPYVKNYEQRNP